MPSRQGSIRLFQFAGINVFLHWSWFLVAIYEINGSARRYSSITWNILEYLSLFLIVLLHEFGHALACRQVGGRADQIVLWPLGGVAYVDPPPRPGATLWSIAAGPLVNVVLFFVLTLTGMVGGLKQARALSRLAKLPRREGFACPCCKTAPPIGAFWKCVQCGQPFDTFQTQAVCPKCNARFAVTGCLDCRRAYAMSEWMAPALVTSAS